MKEKVKMKVYEQYCKWPVRVRWLFFLPISFIVATVMAWILRFVLQYNSLDVLPEIIVDLFFPVLWQSLFLFLVFYTVPKWKMRWVKFFFILRTTFLIVYVILGVVGLIRGIEFASEWEYWKAGIAEGIVFFGSLYVLYELKCDSPQEMEPRTAITGHLIKK